MKGIIEGREVKNLPPIFGIKTGTKLDYMFYTIEADEESGEPVKRILGGLPYLSVMSLTGIPDTGKSVLAEQFAVKQASMGYKSLIVTTETPAEFLMANLRVRATAMGVPFEKVRDRVIFVDASRNEELRSDVGELLEAMEAAIEMKRPSITVVDSITGLYEHNELEARRIARKLFNFLKEKRQTSLLISQKRSSQQSETAEAAGGLGVAHIVDGTIVMDKRVILTKYEENLYRVPIGDVLRTIRIDGCRVAGHDQQTYRMEITPLGLIRILEPLSKTVRSSSSL